MTFFEVMYMIIALVLAVALVLTASLGRKQKIHGNDEGNPNTVKRPLMFNPIFWTYVLFLAFSVMAVVWLGLFQ